MYNEGHQDDGKKIINSQSKSSFSKPKKQIELNTARINLLAAVLFFVVAGLGLKATNKIEAVFKPLIINDNKSQISVLLDQVNKLTDIDFQKEVEKSVNEEVALQLHLTNQRIEVIEKKILSRNEQIQNNIIHQRKLAINNYLSRNNSEKSYPDIIAVVDLTFNEIEHFSGNKTLYRQDLINHLIQVASSIFNKSKPIYLDISKFNLEKIKFTGDLTDFDFSGANLKNADFSYCSLKKMTFDDANLEETNFTGANLSGADLSKALLTNIKLEGTNLINAILPQQFMCQGGVTNGYITIVGCGKNNAITERLKLDPGIAISEECEITGIETNKVFTLLGNRKLYPLPTSDQMICKLREKTKIKILNAVPQKKQGKNGKNFYMYQVCTVGPTSSLDLTTPNCWP